MYSPYEIVSKSALPALRSMIARRLREDYHLTQQQVADKLGVTQASVSNYGRRTRGVMMNLETDPTIARAADRIAASLSAGEADQRDIMQAMTEVCDYIRINHLMCTLHEELEPGFPTEGCSACDGALSFKDSGKLKILAGG